MLASEAYLPWNPSEVWHDNFIPHPTHVCEPINLATAAQPPIKNNRLSEETKGLSTLQYETICRILDSFEVRGAFLLGDATGVGKGRTIAGLIAELFRRDPCGRIMWVSANVRLRDDAAKELAAVGMEMDERVVFTSYSSLQNSQRTDSASKFLVVAEHPVVILDECHALRNTRAKCHQTAMGFLNRLRAQRPIRILYSSATACSTPAHMEYLNGLGLFDSAETPFVTFDTFAKALRMHGSSLMELLAIDLRARGAYVARQLSFADVRISHDLVKLSREQIHVYDACVRALENVDGEDGLRGTAQQSFFQRLLTGMKTHRAIQLAREYTARGASVVISCVNTGEAAIRHHANAHSPSERRTLPRVGEHVISERGATIDRLPINPIDAVVDAFGVDQVAELTGRRKRVVRQGGRCVLANLPSIHDEVEAFQTGTKHVAVLSKAGGIGISLHDAVDGRPRVHIVLEMPWSAEELLQQMGRTHRSSSRQAPAYILLTTDVPAEMRFASSLVGKLQTFGALVKADRGSCNLSFLPVPRWTAAQKRSIALYLAIAQAHDPATPSCKLSRTQALRVCRDTERGHVDAQIKAQLTERLNHVMREPDNRAALIGAAVTLYPEETVMLMENWTPLVHKQFPRLFRQRVLTLLLCASSWATHNTLGVLDNDCLMHVIAHMARPLTQEEAVHTGRSIHNNRLGDLANHSVDVILNRMLGMELSLQKNFIAIADMFTAAPTRKSTACLLQYAREQVGAGLEPVIVNVTPRTFSTHTCGVFVDVVYETRDTPEPPVCARIWKHSLSNRTCWTDGTRTVYNDNIVSEERIDPAGFRRRGYYECGRHEWAQALRRQSATVQRRLRRAKHRFHLATVNATQLWEQSCHRILRVPPNVQYTNGLVGLLMLSE